MGNIFETHVGMDGKSYRSNGVASPSVIGTGLPTDWDQIMKDLTNQVAHSNYQKHVTKMSTADINGEMVKSYHLKFRGITFIVMLPYDAGEYFSDLKNITKDELRVFEVVYPNHHAKIKEAWGEAYTKVQAGIIFDKED